MLNGERKLKIMELVYKTNLVVSTSLAQKYLPEVVQIFIPVLKYWHNFLILRFTKVAPDKHCCYSLTGIKVL